MDITNVTNINELIDTHCGNENYFAIRIEGNLNIHFAFIVNDQ